MQKMGSGTSFNFIWHNFGPYSQELAILGRDITVEEINVAPVLDSDCSIKFIELKKGNEYNSKFIEMMADIIFLKENMGISNKEALFLELVRYHSYLEDRNLFELSVKRLELFNLI